MQSTCMPLQLWYAVMVEVACSESECTDSFYACPCLDDLHLSLP